jgi:tRNA(Ile)-lysidine synthase TilS/MesJ
MLTYCTKCVMPSTKPDLHLDENVVCNACRSYEARREVDWPTRKTELLKILDKYRSKNGENWDCIVPVSGGKDSTYQVVQMLLLGMNPLCVTATTCDDLRRLGYRTQKHRKHQTARRRLSGNVAQSDRGRQT